MKVSLGMEMIYYKLEGAGYSMLNEILKLHSAETKQEISEYFFYKQDANIIKQKLSMSIDQIFNN